MERMVDLPREDPVPIVRAVSDERGPVRHQLPMGWAEEERL
jgi:hypothetical protein